MYSEQLLNLGRIHLYLLHASNLIDEKRVIPVPPGVIHRPTLTDFGKEVENDEINWWVFKREANILELKEKTIIALQSAEILKKSSEKLFRPFHTSEEFTLAYERFAKERNLEIKAVLDYVKWLFQKDELAPAILYNYRTWGSTRMSDRTMVVQIKDIDDTECLKNLTDIVLGKLKRGGSVIDKVRSEMEYELFENMVSEEYESSPIKVSNQEVQIRAVYESLHEFAEYFEQLRDSLRNIILEIEKHQNEERIFSSDTFWKTFILKAHTSIKTEQKILDFKETLDMWQAPKGLGKKETKHRFAELVAGFANNQGGVIIVGVTDSQPRKIVGIGNDSKTIENEMKYTRSTISNYIEYDSEFVHLQQVVIPGENDNEILCLVIAIRQTRSRVGVKSLDGRSYSYPFREETGLVWKDPEKISSMKIHIKHNNYDFLNRLSQFILEA